MSCFAFHLRMFLAHFKDQMTFFYYVLKCKTLALSQGVLSF